MKNCRTCKKTKTASEFNKRAKSIDGLDLHCKSCKSKYHKRYYAEKSERRKQIAAHRDKARRENADNLYQYLLKHPCVDCGESDPIVLEFDHLSDKEHNISKMCYSHPWKKILVEIAKCVVRCANCHRRRTAQQFDWYKLQAGQAHRA